MLKKILIGLAVTAVTLVAAGLVFVWQVGAWNILFPSSSHDVVAPEMPELDGAVLVFSKTNSFRHKEGIAAGIPALEEIARSRKLATFATENGAVFNTEDLRRFRAEP